MADVGQGPEEAPLDAAAIRRRLEQVSQSRRRWEEALAAAAAEEEEEEARGLVSQYEVALEAVDEWDSSAAAIAPSDLDAYLEWLRKEVRLAEEKNQELSEEIGVLGETATNDMVQLDADIEALEWSLSKLGSKGLNHLEGSTVVGLSDSTDSCRNQDNADMDYKFEVLELSHQKDKSEVELKLFQDLQRTETWWQLVSMLSKVKLLDFKDNCLRVFLKAPMNSDCVIYRQTFDCSIESFVENHELLIEVDEDMEPKKVQIFPSDVCVDKLIERLRSSRGVISGPSLGWLIRQVQHHIILNILRRSLVNGANNSRHSFEYVDKDDTVVAHLVGGIDAFIKISEDWPLSSNGLKLISIRNSGTQQMNITLGLLCRAKELANGLELQTRRHLVRFIDAVEEILVREMQSELHSGRTSG